MQKVIALVCLLAAVCGAAVAQDPNAGISNTFALDNGDNAGYRVAEVRPLYNTIAVKDITIRNKYTARVNWESHVPGKVWFQLNSKAPAQATLKGCDEWEMEYDLGADMDCSLFGVTNQLRVWAEDDKGVKSREKLFKVMGYQLPEWAVSNETKKGIISYKIEPFIGKVTFYGDVAVPKDPISGKVTIPNTIPVLGGKYGLEWTPFEFAWELSAAPLLAEDGFPLLVQWTMSGATKLDAEAGTKRKFEFAVMIEGKGELIPKARLEEISGILSAGATFLTPRAPLFCACCGCCHTGYCPYAQLGLGITVTGSMGLESADPGRFWGLDWTNAEVGVSLDITGPVGAGSEGSIYYIAGTIGGKPGIVFQFPRAPGGCGSDYIKQVTFDLYARYVVECAWWKKTEEYTFNLYTCPSGVSMADLPQKSGGKVEPVDRDYLRAGEDYLQFPSGASLAAIGGMPDPITNVGTTPAPSVAATTEGGLLLFVADDANKPTGQHQEIYLARWTGAEWGARAPLTANNSPDIQPAAAMDSAGKQLAVWVRGATPTGTEQGPEDVVPGFEIVWSSYDTTGASWSPPAALTSNAHVDMLPWFQTLPGGGLRVLWLSSPTNAVRLWPDADVTPNVDVLAADWNGASFGAPYTVAAGLRADNPPAVLAAAEGEWLAYSRAPAAGDETAEVLARFKPAGGQWGADVALTSDALHDMSPQICPDGTGTPVMAWVKRMVPGTDSEGNETHTDQLWYSRWTGSAWGAPVKAYDYLAIKEPKLVRNNAGNLVLIFSAASNEFSDLYFSVYDSALGAWGAPQQWTRDQGEETMLSVATSDDRVLAAFTKRRIDLTDPSGVPQIGLSDIYLLAMSPGVDLYLGGGDVTISPASPVRGEAAALSATVHLAGDSGLANVPVAFFDGDPASGGTQIAEVTIPSLLPGGSQTVTAAWTPPADGLPHSIWVVVDWANAIEEADDTTNNRASLALFTADLVASAPEALSYPGPDSVVLGATITNTGTGAAPASQCALRIGSAGGPALATVDVPALKPGEVAGVQVPWDTTAVPEGVVTVVCVADAAGGVPELDEANNTAAGTIGVQPDLAAVPTTAAAGPGGAEVVITNAGAKPATACIVRLSSGAGTLGEAPLDALPVGASALVTIPIPAGAAYDRLVLTANPDWDCSDEVTFRNNAVTILASSATTIGKARLLKDGTKVALGQKPVSGVFDGSFYIQEDDRSAGIKVLSSSAPGVGQLAEAAGTVTMAGVEKVLVADSVAAGAAASIRPIAVLRNHWLGGHLYGPEGLLGFDDWAGIRSLLNTGLLVSVTGQVTYADPAGAFAYIHDGSMPFTDGNKLAAAGADVQGVRILLPAGASAPQAGAWVAVTGVSSTATVGGRPARAVRARTAADVQVVQEAGL